MVCALNRTEPVCSSITQSIMRGLHLTDIARVSLVLAGCFCRLNSATIGLLGETVVSWSLLTIGNARSVGVTLISSTSTAILHGSAHFGFVLMAASVFHSPLPQGQELT